MAPDFRTCLERAQKAPEFNDVRKALEQDVHESVFGNDAELRLSNQLYFVGRALAHFGPFCSWYLQQHPEKLTEQVDVWRQDLYEKRLAKAYDRFAKVNGV